MNASCSQPAQSKQKTCESCGASFTCSADSGPCWCESIQLDGKARARLRATFADCLCPACLAASPQATCRPSPSV